MTIFFFRICLLGERLLSTSSYVTCSKNDTLLKAAYSQSGGAEFWNKTVLRFISGVPGITSGIFTGEYLTKCIKGREWGLEPIITFQVGRVNTKNQD